MQSPRESPGHRRAPSAVLLVLVGVIGVPAEASRPFQEHEVVIGPAERQTVVVGSFLGRGVADLAVVSIDDNGDRRLRLFAFGDGRWAPALDATLGPEVLFVDGASIGGRDRLITYAPGRLRWFDPGSAAERSLVETTSSFAPPRTDEIPHVDVTRDVNGDGRDDLVVPGDGGFRVFVQLADGAFADPLTIGPKPDLSRIYGADGYRYNPWANSRIHEMDCDGDGRGDLVFWSEDHFEAHLQQEGGLFSPTPESFTTVVAFDSDDPSSLAVGEMTGRVLHSLSDLNGDGTADLVVASLEGARPSSKRSSYEVHFGARAPGGLPAFGGDVDLAFRPAGRVQLGMERLDLDGDGSAGLMFTTIDADALEGSLWKKIKGFMGDDVRLALDFYRTGDDLAPGQPGATRVIALDGVPSHREPGWVPLEIVLRGATHEMRRTDGRWPRAFNRTLLIGDVTGDGRADLLMEPEFRELHLFVGVAGPGLFDRRPQKVAVTLPVDEEYAWLTDLDNDGRQDIVLHHRFTLRDVHGAPKLPPGAEPQRVTLLIAR